MQLLILAATAATLALLSWRSAQTRRALLVAADAEWSEAATALGLQRTEDGSLRGEVRGVHLHVERAGRGWRASAELADPAHISVTARPDFPTWPGGPPLLTVGDDFFDEELVLRGDPGTVLAVLDGNTRAALRLAMSPWLSVSKGAVLRQSGSVGDDLVEQLDGAVRLAELFGAPDDEARALAYRARRDRVGDVRLHAVRVLFAKHADHAETHELFAELLAADADDPRLVEALQAATASQASALAGRIGELASGEAGPVALEACIRLAVDPGPDAVRDALPDPGAARAATAFGHATLVADLLAHPPTVALVAAIGELAGVDAVAPLDAAVGDADRELARALRAAIARIQDRAQGSRGALTAADPALLGGQLEVADDRGGLAVIETEARTRTASTR